MKLIELISYFRKEECSLEEFCKRQSLNFDSEVIEIYMPKPFNLNTEIEFFEIEKTEGMTEYESNGTTYFNLFDFYYFLDAIDESKSDNSSSLNDSEIAYKLFSYAITDA